MATISKFDSIQKVAYIPRDKDIDARIKEKALILEKLEKEALKPKKKNGKAKKK
jgi:hypothetical protein